MGAALLCAPFFSSVALGANALLTSGDDEAKKSYLPGIASGETIATLAITEDNGKWDFSGIELAATQKDGGWVLERPQDVRHRRARGQPHHRGRPHGRGRLALRRAG